MLPIDAALEFFAARDACSGWRGGSQPRSSRKSARLTFLVDVGLDYLTLERKADTLSRRRAQRIRLASQIGSRLVGVMYVLDEPSIGLHQRDNERLLGDADAAARPQQHRDRGRTRRTRSRLADHVVDIGPAPACTAAPVVARASSPTS